MEESDRLAFDEVNARSWVKVFEDPGTGNWRERWFLDGEVGQVTNGTDGMQLVAGPEFKNDAHHIVLWTRESFEGDLKIEYDYTRLDAETRCVNILYIQATGNGLGPYSKDITKWNELRRVPAMRMYFNYMNAYHISYAAFPNNEDTTSYIRARRYKANNSGLSGSELKPDYFPVGLFKTGVPHRITVIKRSREINLRVENPEQVYFCRMTNPNLPEIEEGRIGLRHMFTRSALYKNFRVSRSMQQAARTHNCVMSIMRYMKEPPFERKRICLVWVLRPPQSDERSMRNDKKCPLDPIMEIESIAAPRLTDYSCLCEVR